MLLAHGINPIRLEGMGYPPESETARKSLMVSPIFWGRMPRFMPIREHSLLAVGIRRLTRFWNSVNWRKRIARQKFIGRCAGRISRKYMAGVRMMLCQHAVH